MCHIVFLFFFAIVMYIFFLFCLDDKTGPFGGQEGVIYWRCEVGQTLNESIAVPMLNDAAEQALLTVAQQVIFWADTSYKSWKV